MRLTLWRSLACRPSSLVRAAAMLAGHRPWVRVPFWAVPHAPIGRLLRWLTGLKAIEKERGKVQVTRVYLRPPWASTVLHLDRSTWFTVGSRSGRRLVEQLTAEGFVVESEHAWLTPTVRADLQEADRVGSGARIHSSRMRWYRLGLVVVAAYALFDVVVLRIL